MARSTGWLLALSITLMLALLASAAYAPSHYRSLEHRANATNAFGDRQAIGDLHGYVLNKTGAPIPGATLALYNATAYFETTTNFIGVYIFTNLEGSDYTVVVFAAGMITQTHSGLGPFSKDINFTLLPFLEVSRPSEGSIVNTLSFNVTGTTEAGATVMVYPEGDLDNRVEFVAGSGLAGMTPFSAWINITQSTTRISVHASNATGYSETKDVTISVARPTITLHYPSRTIMTTVTASPLVIRGLAFDTDGGTNLELSLKVGSGSWQKLDISSDGSFAHAIAFDTSDNGKYSATLRAVDHNGLIEEFSFNYTLSWKQLVSFEITNAQSQKRIRYVNSPSECTYTLNVRNDGNAEDSFVANAMLDPGDTAWELAAYTQTITVKAGAIGNITFIVKVPKIFSDETRNGTINVTSQHDTTKYFIIPMRIVASGIKEATHDSTSMQIIGLIVGCLVAAILVIIILKYRLNRPPPVHTNPYAGRMYSGSDNGMHEGYDHYERR